MTNPGFESGSTGWTPTAASAFPATSFKRGTTDIATPYAGSYAYAIGNLASGALRSESLSITGGGSYGLYAWVRGELDPNGSHGTWGIRARFYGSSGQEIGVLEGLVAGPESLSQTWAERGGVVTAPPHATAMRVELFNDFNSGWVAFDDVRVQGYDTTKYYYLNGQRIAMRRCTGTTCEAPIYLHGDHLGSASLATDAAGRVVSEMRYTPYGEVRSGALPTDRRFTGQRYEAGTGLYDYNARWYDPVLGRFIQADTIVPGKLNPQSLNRYSYVYNNALRYTDPSGHCIFGLDTVVCIAVAGAALGAAAGYGYQVYENVQRGMSFQDALTTDIQARPIVGGAFLGGTVGAAASLVATALGIGAAGATVAGGATTLAGGAVQAAGADGDYTNEVEAVGNAGYGALTRAADYGIRPYNALEGAVRGTELERHHLVEQRFAPMLGQKTNQMLSVVVTKAEHQEFTNAWQSAIGYRNSGQALRTDTATPDAIWKAAQSIYAGYPTLLEGARQTLFK